MQLQPDQGLAASAGAKCLLDKSGKQMVKIRDAFVSDADALSVLIVDVLYASNLDDYGPENIARVASHFTPDGVRTMLANRETIVAELGGEIVGTAGIGPASTHDGKSIRTFFVNPNMQGKGIGRALFETLMKRVEATELVSVRSSIAAEPFYATLGFVKIRTGTSGQLRCTYISSKRN